MARLSFLFLLSLAVGCAARLGASEPRWSRSESQHFVLYTDLPEPRAQAQVRELEKLLSAYQQHGWQVRGELPLKLNVVMFKNAGELEDFTGPNVVGYHVQGVLFEPWVVLAAPTRGRDLSVLQHELTHYIAFQGMQHQPRWYAEGVACFFQTAYFDDDGLFAIGEVPRDLHASLTRYGLLRARSLLSDSADTEEVRFYPTAWLLTHYLMNERGDAFVAYQRALARGKAHVDAWQQAFPDLENQSLDRELEDYFVRGSYAKYLLKVSTTQAEVHSRRLTRADELGLQAILWRSCAGCSLEEKERHAAESIKLALALDPHQVQATALQLLAQPESKASLEKARSLTQRQPDEWMTWMTLAMLEAEQGVLGRIEEDPDPVERVLSLAPRQSYAWLLAAVRDHAQNRPAQALEHARKARRLAPTNPGVLATLIDLYSDMRQCSLLADTLAIFASVEDVKLDAKGRAKLMELISQCEVATTP